MNIDSCDIILSQHMGQQGASMIWQHIRQDDNSKVRRRLYTSNYTRIPAYLMDFGFGGFIGYGKGVSVGLVMEELRRRMMYDG